jgi:hypothetical protein
LKCALHILSKGNSVNILKPGHGRGGNTNELGNVSRSPGKSFLFFLTVTRLGISLAGEEVEWLAEHFSFKVSGVLLMALETPRECFISCLAVLITAAGLQGE